MLPRPNDVPESGEHGLTARVRPDFRDFAAFFEEQGRQRMYIEIVRPSPVHLTARVEDGFDFLSPEYRRLFAESDATAFQSPLWLHCLYSVLVKRLGAKPHVIAVRDCGGRLRMLIPLVLQRTAGVSILQPADLGVSDYNCIVADRQTLKAAAGDAAFAGIIKACLHAADVLIFRKIQWSPETVAAILGGNPTPNENSGYQLALDAGSFEEWQKTRLKKRFRNGVRRKQRGLQEAHGDVETVTFTEPAEIERAIEFIRELRTAKFKDDILNGDAYLEFYKRYAVLGAATGEAVTSGLRVRGELVSADFGMDSDDAHYSILCASKLDDYRAFSPGLQSLFAIIRRSHEQRLKRFDFGIGKTRQKSDFGSTEIPLFNLTVARSVKGRAVSLVYDRAKPVKTLLRRLTGKIR